MKLFRIKVPKKEANVLISLWFTWPKNYFCYTGRLYRGYIGIMANVWRFQFNLWILNYEREVKR